MAFTDRIDDAMALAATSTVKTNLNTDFDALGAELATASSAGAFSADVLAQLEDELVALAEKTASEMSEWVNP